jgi:ribosomal subunit interface protein
MKVEKRSVHDEAHTGKVAHICEAHVALKGAHKSVTVQSESEDMYATIDALESLLARKLRKAKERQEDTKKARGQQGKSEMNAEEVDDDE